MSTRKLDELAELSANEMSPCAAVHGSEEPRGRSGDLAGEQSRTTIAVIENRPSGPEPSTSSEVMSHVKSVIAGARRSKHPDFARNAKVVEIITKSLNNRGEFFHDGLRA